MNFKFEICRTKFFNINYFLKGEWEGAYFNYTRAMTLCSEIVNALNEKSSSFVMYTLTLVHFWHHAFLSRMA